MKLFVIITLKRVVSRGGSQGTDTATLKYSINVRPGTTREAVFDWVCSNLPEQYQGAPIVFYSAEPDHFTSPAEKTPDTPRSITA